MLRPVFSERLQSAMDEVGMSIETVSQKCSIPVARLNQILAGVEEPSFSEGMVLCRLFGISPEWALNLKD